MANQILFKRGAEPNLPVLAPGEPAFCTDTQSVFIGTTSGTNKKLAVAGADPTGVDELVYAMEAGQTLAENDFVHLVAGKVRKTIAGDPGYFGFVVKSVSGGLATVKAFGVKKGFSGLLPGETYYLQPDGTIGTTATAYVAGQAIDANTMSLILEGA